MSAPVYFCPVQEGESVESIQHKVLRLYLAAGLDAMVGAEDLVAIKTHFGEASNENFIDPRYLAGVIQHMHTVGAQPFWTDTNTLYKGPRSNAVEHMRLAEAHGFGLQATGIPVIIADGLSGRDEVRVQVNGKHSADVGIAAAAALADSLLVVSHATGHLVAGYGGAIKNLGMGLSSRKGKLYQHSVVKPWVDAKLCRECGTCIEWCPVDAIHMEDVAAPDAGGATRRAAVIHKATCIGCGECLAACRPGAVRFAWRMSSDKLQERMVEQALGVVKNKGENLGFINFILQVGKDCDCLPSHPADVLVKAVGIVASRDVLAIEHATIDLLEQALGGSLRAHAYDIDFGVQLRHAEAMGMGSAQYELFTLPKE